MTVLNFPSAPAVDETYTANGVTYAWNGSYWAVANTPSTPDSLQTVTDVGNTTTNDIDIGPGNITLDASGSAEFANTILINEGHTTDDGITLSHEGQVKVRGDSLPDDSAGLAIYRLGSTGTSIAARINLDGSATYVGTIKVGGILPDDPNINLNPNGTAVFKGKVTGNRFASQEATIASSAVDTYTLDGIVVPSYSKCILCCYNGASPTQVYSAGMWIISKLTNANTTEISGTNGVASVSCNSSGVITVTTNTATYRSLSFTLLVL